MQAVSAGQGFKFTIVGPATAQNLVVKLDGEICGGVLVENASDDFSQQKKLKNLLPSFAGSSPPISPKTSPTSLWESLVPSVLEKDSNSRLQLQVCWLWIANEAPQLATLKFTLCSHFLRSCPPDF